MTASVRQPATDGRAYPPDLPRHSVSAAGVVVRADGLILAIKRADNGAWVPPGGIVELGEDPRDTVRREVREEAGITAEPQQLTGVYKNMARGVVSLVFRCHLVDGEPHPTPEAAATAWLTGGGPPPPPGSPAMNCTA
jgi:ADP-ribose pyrophosphatase YjhB (NUDIX family)